MDDSAPLPGFNRIGSTSPFNELVGPLFEKHEGGDRAIGLRVAEKHLNRRRIVHGGMISTLVDFAMGYTVARATDPPVKLVTLSLAVDFAGNATCGDWIETRVDVVRSGRRVAFVSGMVWRVAPEDEERIARASATFLLLHPDE
jgi:uncharacterized protein (TIGR00369 family)